MDRLHTNEFEGWRKKTDLRAAAPPHRKNPSASKNNLQINLPNKIKTHIEILGERNAVNIGKIRHEIPRIPEHFWAILGIFGHSAKDALRQNCSFPELNASKLLTK